MNCFEEIRNRLDMRTVAEGYGIEIKRNNTCLCPFHDDHHPSAHIYPKAFHCFTCNLHYDVLGFVMAYFNLSALDGAKKLNDDFNLGISFGKNKTQNNHKYDEKAAILEIRRKKRERFEKWEKKAYQTIRNYYRLIKDWYENLRPPMMDHVPENYHYDKRYEYALQNYAFAESFTLDWIQQFTDEDKIACQDTVDRMQKFLEEQQINQEKPQNPESPRTKSTA